MIQAIIDRKSFYKANTSVSIGYAGTMLDHYKDAYMSIKLHGNEIAKYYYNKDNTPLCINHCGWITNTTKSRLNAIINEFLDGTKNGVYQKDHCWYVTDHGRDYDFDSSAWYSFKSNALDVTHSVTNTELIAV